MSDETDQNIEYGQLTDKQDISNVNEVPIRRKRAIRDAGSAVPLGGSSNPSRKAGLISGKQRFKKANHPIDGNAGKLLNDKGDLKRNSPAKFDASGDRADQDKRDLRKQQTTSSELSQSREEDKVKCGKREGKRNSYSMKTMKPKSRAIKQSDLMTRSSLAKVRGLVHDKGGYSAVKDDAKLHESEFDSKNLGDEADLEQKSTEYEETGDDEDLEAPVGYKENAPEVSQNSEESEKVDLPQNSAEDDDFYNQEVDKREAEVLEEEYEGVDDQDEPYGDTDETDDSNIQGAKIRPETSLSEKTEKSDSRVKRHDTEANGGSSEQNDTTNLSEDAKGPLERLGNLGEKSLDNLKRETDQNSVAVSSSSSHEAQEDTLKGREETNESLKQESMNVDTKSDASVDWDAKRTGDSFSDDMKKESKNFANDDLDTDYEKRVEQQIQQRIDSIKEEIKRGVEEKQKIREIEVNNAKYDAMQSEDEEDEVENNQSLDAPSERKSVSKRSIIDGIRRPHQKAKRHILKRVKRSSTADERQLRAIEGVETLDPDVLVKAKLRHESIRKRSAPTYGATDEDASKMSRFPIKRSIVPRQVYLVKSEPQISSTTNNREIRNPIIIPEQAQANIDDELPPGVSLDQSLLEDTSSAVNNRLKRSPERFARRRRASAVIPESGVAFLGYRPQDDDEIDEGSEFDDDSFEDGSPHLAEDRSNYAEPYAIRAQYRGDEARNESPSEFLFAGGEDEQTDFLMRRKRGEIDEDEQPVRLHGGGALARRQAKAKSNQMQSARVNSIYLGEK
ncbi:probable serine/threonine-protein kinase kinX [Neodiprion lecontei]|uniref:Probable serine/threonine-protein kinase kinX n=1 Tax=Neodiprion lecontei TaxID=441921 RepID=A0ABM3GL24_NEOLC|nr:probable serine/threonine-protein kinase kinX [Neodiprion lecontei]